jgi:hypothetical protein
MLKCGPFQNDPEIKKEEKLFAEVQVSDQSGRRQHSYFLTCSVYESGKIWSRDFDRFTHFEVLCIRKSSFWNSTIYQYVHIYVWVYTLLQPEQLDRFCLYFVFRSLSITDQKILVPKIEALQIGPKTENGDFTENSSNNSD